jgi:KDO2-lipid IV(A) lauroyltransferase
MQRTLRQAARRLSRAIKTAGTAAAGRLAVLLLKAIGRTDPDRMADFGGRFLRRLGPWLPEHRVGRANLTAAFPDWPAAEIDKVLLGAWDNLGRLGAEFAHLDRLWSFDPERPERGRIEFSPGTAERFLRLKNDGKPALIFASHLANWELPAVAAAVNGMDTTVLYRRPNIAEIDRFVGETRSLQMGTLIPTSLDAPVRIADALARGSHVGMLVDQYYVRGVPVTFFGRSTMANPLIARLARRIECPIHGVRAVRLPGHRFRIDLTEAIDPPRNAKGEVEIAATMQVITSVIEGWIREYPEQWLWLHRRWRPENNKS